MSVSAKLQQFLLNKLVATINSIALASEEQPSAKLQQFSINRLAATLNSLSLGTAEQPPPPTPQQATLTGTVTSIIGPVGGAKVTLNSFETFTDSSGKFEITAIPFGTYTLTVTPQALIHKLLLKSTAQRIDVYNYQVTAVIALPLNTLNLTLGLGMISVIGTVTYLITKPKYY